MTIGQKVAELRKLKNMNLRQFGELVELRFGYINQLEKDRANSQSTKQISPTIRTLKQICNKTNYDLALFLAETGYISTERVCVSQEEVEWLNVLRSGNINKLKEHKNEFNFNDIAEIEKDLAIIEKNKKNILKNE